jgi:hypothetical protein
MDEHEFAFHYSDELVSEITAYFGDAPVRQEIAFEQAEKVFLTANSIAKNFLDATDDKKREYAGILLSNSWVRDQKIQRFQYKEPFQTIANIPEIRAIFSKCCRTWIRTKIPASRGRSPTVRRSGNSLNRF